LLSTPSNSNVNSPARSSWRPLYGGEYFRYSESILTDILSKREFLYRNYFTNKGLRLALPPFLVSSPLNPFLLELQNLYSFTDPIYISSESSRELVYYTSNFFSFVLFKDLWFFLNQKFLELPVNLNFLHSNLSIYFLGGNTAFSFSNSTDFYKNQYRPIKKGVSNMIRLHATGAIAMPIETRLHLLASSKDVIHS
jgi:hypothetical protein